MARRVTDRWWACVLVLAVLGWHGAFPVVSLAADPLLTDIEEDLPDMNFVKAQAESGRPKYQTQLGDLYMAAADLTNAVFWYRKAAEQGHAPAQLSLAGCLMAGRGVARNPAEAARLLRQAADGIEASATNGRRAQAESAVPVPSAGAGVAASISTPSAMGASANASPTSKPIPAAPSPASATNLARVERANTLLTAEPVLQSVQPVLRPPADPR